MQRLRTGAHSFLLLHRTLGAKLRSSSTLRRLAVEIEEVCAAEAVHRILLWLAGCHANTSTRDNTSSKCRHRSDANRESSSRDGPSLPHACHKV